MIRIGIDIGGTFTDFVVYHPKDGSFFNFKVPSTPDNPAEAVLDGLLTITDINQATIIHGSTVATNALLERKGARTALIATQGFKDIIQIGRQNRPSLYDWNAKPPSPLVPPEIRFEVQERVEHTGEVTKQLRIREIKNLIKRIKTYQPEAIAVCLLFSYLHPQHEKMIAEMLHEAGIFVSISSEVLPEFREYERCSTTVVNAYVSPKLASYLTVLQSAVSNANLQVMQSNGGMIGIDEAKKFGARCILSGPAGGIIGASYIANSMQQSTNSRIASTKVITFDMGGTSTDVSLIDENPRLTKESIIGGYPIALPLLDIHTIGAGGGSIAQVDLGDVLKVGPESAGANPGPACYGIGELPTVTDANLLLGRILPDLFLGGKVKLDIDRAKQSLQRVGNNLDLDVYETALGVVEVVNAHMERALRVISVERGYDPREFSLLTFGGAGGLHATDLARRTGIPLVIVPPLASTLSAFGMLMADYIKDYSQTVMLIGDDNQDLLTRQIKTLTKRGRKDLELVGFQSKKIQFETSIDMRYAGQSYELNIPYSKTLKEDFSAAHQKEYGYIRTDVQTEIVNARVRAIGKVEKPQITPKTYQSNDPTSAFVAVHAVHFKNIKINVPFYRGERLQPGNLINGPAIILRSDTTILLEREDTAEVDPFLNLVIRVE